jgi:hypothetical protein
MDSAPDRTRQEGGRRAGGRISTKDALERLAAKEVAPAYRAPRGNQDLDRAMTDNSVDRLGQVMGR